ncbi:MAG: 4-amino-4-deoxy-L-arabinose transferase [Chloroflexota bacterium]|jgi:hypothetical protein|nr:4-amino-4-deoxy-L-arabinose transferase [Chloroflexota bacterium]
MAVPLLLFLFALSARVATAIVFPDPAYPDSFYYVNLAHQLAAGHGLNVDFIWNFVEVGGRLPDAAGATLPIPSNAHWMPLAALVQVPFIWLLGPTTVASGLPFWLASAAAAPLTWWIAIDAGRPRWQALGAALLVAVPGAVVPFLAQPDNFGLFMPLGALSLWACARGLRGHRRSFALGGVCVGLATLARSDGLLFGVPLALAFLYDLVARRRSRATDDGRPLIGWGPALACAAAFAIVVAPWYLRQLVVFGSLSPSAANGRILWITDYRQLYSVAGDTSLGAFLGQGIGPLLASRLGGLAAAAGIFAAMPLLVFLAPFTAIGAWLGRRDPNVVPWLIYAVTLLLFSGLLFAVHVPYGTFLHSAVALMPHAYILAMAGIAVVVAWVARRRSGWDVQRASRVFGGMAVAVAMVTGAAAAFITLGHWRLELDVRRQLAAPLAAVPSTDRVMSPDAGGYRYLTGHPGIVTPDDPLPVVEQALRLYDIRWLALERDHITSALAPLLSGSERPAWLSAPIVVASGARGTGGPGTTPADSGSTTAPSLPAGALYAVCLQPSDTRCAP